MAKALVTFGTGDYAALLDITRPGLQAYAARHGYDYIEQPPVGELSRPASWYKVPAMVDCLLWADEVLWVGADVVVVDSCDDLAAMVPAAAWQAVARHRTHQGFTMGEVPNAEVWLVRPPMIPVLRRIWQMTTYVDHPWWEQAALHELLGYRHQDKTIFPVVPGPATPLRRRTHFLDESWNCIDPQGSGEGVRLMHMAGMPVADKARWMRRWAGGRDGA